MRRSAAGGHGRLPRRPGADPLPVCWCRSSKRLGLMFAPAEAPDYCPLECRHRQPERAHPPRRRRPDRGLRPACHGRDGHRPGTKRTAVTHDAGAVSPGTDAGPESALSRRALRAAVEPSQPRGRHCRSGEQTGQSRRWRSISPGAGQPSFGLVRLFAYASGHRSCRACVPLPSAQRRFEFVTRERRVGGGEQVWLVDARLAGWVRFVCCCRRGRA